MELLPNLSLRPYNTFGISVQGNVAVFRDVADLLQLLELQKQPPTLILGGGSNLLLRSDVPGWIWKNEILGISVVAQNDDWVWVEAGAGETWHDFVMHCVAQGWGGLENLALIPGKVGASPMQNIGAYGVEIKDCFDSLEAVSLVDGSIRRFSTEECQFGYRESVFKHALKGQYAIVSVRFKLSRRNPSLALDYGAIREELDKAGVAHPGIADVAAAVIRIRKSKLPDPAELGNAGSFFKNPVVDVEVAERIRAQHADVVQYPAGEGKVKLAAGWLIEKAGWKGFRRGDAGVHAKQALVLVNYGQATGQEIWQLSQDILDDLEQRFGVRLEREVNIR